MNKMQNVDWKGDTGHMIHMIRGWLKRKGTILLLAAIAVVSLGMMLTTLGKNAELTTHLEDVAAQLDAAENELESTKTTLKTTEEDLTAANEQIELLEDTTEALNRQVSGLNATKEALESEIEKLLNVKEAKPKITRSQLEEQVSAIGELATLKYIYTNSSRKTGNLTWLWGWTLPFSDSSLLVTYDGTIKAGIALSEIQFNVNESGRTITVTLPKSKVLDNYIPQETINVLEVKDGLFNSVTFNDYNKFISEEKIVMEKRAIDMGILNDADKDAKNTVESFLKSIPGMDTYKLVVQ